MWQTLLVLSCLVLGVIGYNLAVAWLMQRASLKATRDPKTGILKGGEPVFLKGNQNKAALLIHGFIGTPSNFGNLPEQLHRDGWAVSAPLLPGHGTDPRDFSKVTAQDLINAVKSAYEELCRSHDHLVVIGHSMGASLGILLAASQPSKPVKALVLLAPYFKIKHYWYYLLPSEVYHQIFSPFIPYLKRPAGFRQVFNKEAIPKIVDYDFISMKGTSAALEIAKRTSRQIATLRDSSIEMLFIHSEKDKATDYDATRQIAETFPADHTKLVTLTRSNHLVLLDYEAQQVEDAILKFLNE